MATLERDPRYLRAIVDMGSNGIRLSISDLRPPTARIMPTLYQFRAGISLYDAQYPPGVDGGGERQPIDEPTIVSVVAAFENFKRTCQDFGVSDENVCVLATEATRTAVNSEAFRARIKTAVGWEVVLLSKEEEGRVGAMGVASSLPEVSGLVMDLGGGSTQLSWLIKAGDSGEGDIRMPDSGAVSMPFGAAAMTRRLGEAERNGTTVKLKEEVQAAVKDAYARLEVPHELEDLAKSQGGFTLYLSGGGFRGWGYILMSRHRVHPYPVPVVNGFKVARENFMNTDDVKMAAAATLHDEEDDIFRVSDRRASQVPAVAFLINVLAETLPQIKEVRFCQGGVREGYLFSSLSPEVRAQNPLVVSTQHFQPGFSYAFALLLQSSFPLGYPPNTKDDYKVVFTKDRLQAFANLIHYHSSHSKDLQATAALRSTTSGILAGVHGVLHESRTLLALLLCERWGGEVPPTDEGFKKNMEQLVEPSSALWWIKYIGAVAALIAAVYPAGYIDETKTRLTFGARWNRDNKNRTELALSISLLTPADINFFGKDIRNIEKSGKKSRWIGGRDGFGYRVVVETGLLHTRA